MKVRHINNIIIELEEWETQILKDVLRKRLEGTAEGCSVSLDFLCDLFTKLEQLTEREA